MRCSWLLVALVTMGCAATGPTDYVLVEDQTGEVAKIAITQYDEAGCTCALDATHLARLGGPSVYYGISGAPVVANGRLVGAIAFQKGLGVQIPFASTLTAQYARIQDMEDVAKVARICEISGDSRSGQLLQEEHESVATLSPGNYIAALSLWGDVRSGVVGVLTSRLPDGTVLTLGHPLDSFHPGPFNRAMFRAHVMAVRLEDRPPTWDWNHLGPIECHAIGAFYYQGPHGPVGRLDAKCPTLHLDIVSDKGGRLSVFMAANKKIDFEFGQLTVAVESRFFIAAGDIYVRWSGEGGHQERDGDWASLQTALAALALSCAADGRDASVRLHLQRR